MAAGAVGAWAHVNPDRAAAKALQRLIMFDDTSASKIDQLIGFPSLILRDMFDKTILVYWITPEIDGAARKKIRVDAIRIGGEIAQFLKGIVDIKSDLFQIGFKEGLVTWDSASAFNQGTDIVASALLSC